MARHGYKLACPALVAGFVLSGTAQADEHVILSARIASLTAGLFCAPEDGDRRAAPDTMAGWIHVPDAPVAMVAEGQVAPALIGLGFGVRYTLRDGGDAFVRYTVTHPPMPPTGITTQSWESFVASGSIDTTFFQFDVEDELQPGDWGFAASIDGTEIFNVGFTVRPAAELPGLLGLCQGGALLSLNQTDRAAAS
jgi:hypothetical protein